MALTKMSYARLAVIGVSGAVFLAAILMAGMLFGHAAFPTPGDPSPAVSPTPSPQQSPRAEFVEFRDEQAGFKISYPATWGPRSSSDPEVAFLASSVDDQSSALVRITPFDRQQALQRLEEELGQEATTLDLNLQLTEQRVRNGESVQEVLLGPKIVDFAGGRASYYVYSFDASQDGSQNGQTGVHAQYFLFEEDRMITLVLQAIPPSEFTRLASTFDRIAQSFERLSSQGASS